MNAFSASLPVCLRECGNICLRQPTKIAFRHLALAALPALSSLSLFANPSFQGIVGTRNVTALNTDGNAAASESFPSAFQWSATEGLTNIGHLAIPGYGPNKTTYAAGISSGGTVIVGSSSSFSGSWFKTHAYRWSLQNGITSLVDVDSVLESHAVGLSDDGRTIAGWLSEESGQHAVLWRDGQEILRLEAGTTFGGISRNGVWATGTKSEGNHARTFRWSLGTGLLLLSPDTGDYFGRAISDDGNVVVGQGHESGQGLETQPFRWTSETGIESLGNLITGEQGYATCLSSDGMTVGGVLFESGAFLWTKASGMRGLKDVLQTDYGLELGDWTLNSAWAISADGRAIGGRGFRQQPFPQGSVEEGFIAKLGEASTPQFELTRAGTSIRLDFVGILQSSSDLQRWKDVESRPTSPFLTDPSDDRLFFRARSH